MEHLIKNNMTPELLTLIIMIPIVGIIIFFIANDNPEPIRLADILAEKPLNTKKSKKRVNKRKRKNADDSSSSSDDSTNAMIRSSESLNSSFTSSINL